MLEGRKILLGITGSIAAYKTVHLVRLLVKSGAHVKIVITHAAKDFVSPLALSTLSKNPVLSDFSNNDSWANHVMLGRWADILVIAPLSCNTLAKMATGICDNLLMSVYLSATCPVVVAPAMDEDMWLHSSTKYNLLKIGEYGNKIIPVEIGELASGLKGEGRMAEPEKIIEWLFGHFKSGIELAGKRAMVTAGPTYEQLDPVRFIGNYSTGKMGIAIAAELTSRGAQVTLVLGPSSADIPSSINTIHVKTAADMFDACVANSEDMDIVVMNAAVADYTPIAAAEEKIKKTEDVFSLQLTKTKDILKHLGQIKKPGQIVVGFALETNNGEEYARKKLEDKNADMIVLNSLSDDGAGFGHDTNKITIFDRYGGVHRFGKKTKAEVAKDIVNAISNL